MFKPNNALVHVMRHLHSGCSCSVDGNALFESMMLHDAPLVDDTVLLAAGAPDRDVELGLGGASLIPLTTE
jgi:hypothetical protein